MKYLKFINGTITFLLGALVFLVPLYFAFLYKDYSVFTIDKTALFQIIVELTAVLILFKLALERFVCENNSLSVFSREAKRVLTFATIFFLIFFLAVVFSEDFHQSFWGSFWRKQGFIAYFHYFLFFLILLYHLNTQKRREKIISAAIAGAFLVSLLGILQWFGYDPLPWQERVPTFGRITSTMGQPIFLANYLLFTIALTTYRLLMNFRLQDFKFQKNEFSLKSFFANNFGFFAFSLYVIILFLQFIALFFTYTRGALLGLFFGILFFSASYPLLVKKNIKAFLKSLLIFFLCCAASLVFIFYTSKLGDWNYSDQIIHRMKNITDFEHGSTALRVKYWNAALEAIQKQPLLGYGPENQQSVLVEYYDNTWIPYEKIGLVPDRAHNEYLDLALAGGPLLLLAYFLFLFSLFYYGIKALYRAVDKNKRTLGVLILGALFAYSLSMFFAFSVIDFIIFFYLFVALLILLINKSDNSFEVVENKKERRTSDLQKRLLIYFSAPAIIILLIMVWQNVNMVRADYHFREARSAFVDRDYLKMYDNYISAFSLNKREKYYKQNFVDDAMMSMFNVGSSQYKKAVTDYAEEMLDDYPGESYYEIHARAKIYALLGEFKNKEYFEKAELEFKKAIRKSQFLPNPQIGLAQVYIRKENCEAALQVFENILSFLPPLDSKLLNREHREGVRDLIDNINSRISYCEDSF